jgi:hypothetical protein
MIGDIASSPSRQNHLYARLRLDLFAETPLGADADAATDHQHADHQFGIDRRVALEL